MISRRNFLGTSATVAAGAALTGCDAPATSSADDSELPPSIARLESWANRATPITTEERAARVENAKRLMRGDNVDALALCGGRSTSRLPLLVHRIRARERVGESLCEATRASPPSSPACGP